MERCTYALQVSSVSSCSPSAKRSAEPLWKNMLHLIDDQALTCCIVTLYYKFRLLHAAQIFNEIGDYEALANALKELLGKQEELVERL